MLHARNISPKHGSVLNTCNDFIRSILNVTSCKGEIASGVAVRGDGGVAGEGRVVGVPKFHSWGKCTMPLSNINSDWISKASSGLCIILLYYINYIILYYIRWSFNLLLGVWACNQLGVRLLN